MIISKTLRINPATTTTSGNKNGKKKTTPEGIFHKNKFIIQIIIKSKLKNYVFHIVTAYII